MPTGFVAFFLVAARLRLPDATCYRRACRGHLHVDLLMMERLPVRPYYMRSDTIAEAGECAPPSA